MAVRHRGSAFHSFRTVVSNEWVLGGVVAYTLHVEALRASAAMAIGAITPRASVNSDIAWAVGTSDREHAWGYCMERPQEEASLPNHENREQRALPAGTRVVCGGPGAVMLSSEENRMLPLVREGDTILVMLEPTKGRLTLQLGTTDTDIVQLQLPNSAIGHPLALAVSLKYAGDAVRISRVMGEEFYKGA